MADNYGAFTEIKFHGTFAQKKLLMPVIADSFEMTPLAAPAITRTISYNDLKGTIPLLGNTPVASQLRELEHSVARGKEFGAYTFEVLKDRISLLVSDESNISAQASGLGTAMSIQQLQQSDALASNLNQLIAARMNTTPQLYNSGDAGDWTAVKPTLAVGKMAASMGIYKPTAIVMGTLAGEYYVDAVGDKVALANLAEWKGAATVHPTLNIPVYISTDIDNLDESGDRAVFCVSNRVPGLMNVIVAVKATSGYNRELGAEEYQYDIWRTPFSNIRQTVDNLNLGVVKAYMREE